MINLDEKMFTNSLCFLTKHRFLSFHMSSYSKINIYLVKTAERMNIRHLTFYGHFHKKITISHSFSTIVTERVDRKLDFFCKQMNESGND